MTAYQAVIGVYATAGEARFAAYLVIFLLAVIAKALQSINKTLNEWKQPR